MAGPIQAKAPYKPLQVYAGPKNTLRFTTPAGSQVIASQSASGTFEGEFSYGGIAKPIKIEKLSEDDLKARVDSARDARIEQIMVKPAADVPATCAAFGGVWTGTWPGYGQKWLWVVEVNANCVARYADRINRSIPETFQSSQIKEGLLVRQKPDGLEYYELRGDELRARFAPNFGAHNSTVYRRTQPAEK